MKNAHYIATVILGTFNNVGQELPEGFIKLCLCETNEAQPELVDSVLGELCDAGYLQPTVAAGTRAAALVLTAEGDRARR